MATTTKKNNWIKSLLASGLKPEIVVLEEHRCADALVEAEQFWIAYFGFVGCVLTNMTAGGDGQYGVIFPPERKLKISLSHGGLPSHKRDEVAQRYRAGETLRQIAASFNTGSKVIFRIVKDANVPLRPKGVARRMYYDRMKAVACV